jgi:hypothetical protein
MPNLLESVVEYFETDGWPFEQIEDMPILKTGFSGDNGSWVCLARTIESQQQMVFYSVCPTNIPEANRDEVTRYLSRVNYDMIIGNFEIDLDDGEVRYKTSIDVEGTPLTHALLEPLVYQNVNTMDQYLPGIVAIVEDGLTAEQALSKLSAEEDDDE